MVEYFKPFLRHLVSSGQSRKTLRSHRDNLWILGGEIISKLHEDPRLRKRPTDQIVLAVLDDEGGPLISHGSEDQQRSFDSTCRKFFRFVKERNTGAAILKVCFCRGSFDFLIFEEFRGDCKGGEGFEEDLP